MGQIKPIVIPITGELNTLHPAETNEVGSLQDAIDIDHHSWAPRPNRQAQTQPLELAGATYVPGPNRLLLEYDGNNTFSIGEFTCAEQRDLRTAWNLTIWFNLNLLKATNTMQLFEWRLKYGPPTISAIKIGVYGSTYGVAADRGKVYATVLSTSSAGIASSTITLKSLAALSTLGKLTTDRHCIRLIRDGPYVELELDGIIQDRTTSFSPTEYHEGSNESAALANLGFWLIGDDSSPGTNANIWFNGYVFSVVMRNGAWSYGRQGSQAPTYALEHQNPRAKDVLLYLIGEAVIPDYYYSWYTLPDLSKYGATGQSLYVTSRTDRIDNFPYVKRAQGMTNFVDSKGFVYNAVLSSGVLCYTRIK